MGGLAGSRKRKDGGKERRKKAVWVVGECHPRKGGETGNKGNEGGREGSGFVGGGR